MAQYAVIAQMGADGFVSSMYIECDDGRSMNFDFATDDLDLVMDFWLDKTDSAYAIIRGSVGETYLPPMVLTGLLPVSAVNGYAVAEDLGLAKPAVESDSNLVSWFFQIQPAIVNIQLNPPVL